MSALIAQDTGSMSRWRWPLLAWLVTVALLMVGYAETASTMVGIWLRSETFAHAMVVPPISIWLAWRLRRELAAAQPLPAPWVLLPLLGMAVVWRIGHLVQISVVEQFMFVAMLVLTVPAVLGLAVARTLMFPLGFLFFAVPFGEFMTPTLVSFTADFTVAALRFSGVPVVREGMHFLIPSGSWAVVEECSGIRYLMASAMVGTLFAYLNYRSYGRRLAFIAVSLVVPIVANWLRAYMIVMIGHLSDNRLAAGVDHILYGWVFFGIVITAMFMVGSRWADAVDPVMNPAQAVPPAIPMTATHWLMAAGLAVVASTGVQIGLQVWLTDRDVAVSSAGEIRWPNSLAPGWVAAPELTAPFTPVFVGPTAQPQQAYRGPDGRVVWAYLAHFPQQDDARRLVSSVNVIVHSTDTRWHLAARSNRALASAGSLAAVTAFDIVPTNLAVQSERLRAWRIFRIDGQWTASDVKAKALQAWQVLRGHGSAGSAVVLYSAGRTTEDTDDALTAFAKANNGIMQRWIDGLANRP